MSANFGWMQPLLGAAAMAAMAWGSAGVAGAQSTEPVKIGVLNDQSGPYSASGGQGSVIAARMAVEDFGGSVLGRPVEVIFADNLSKPDVATAISRKWIDEDGVTAIVDGGSSSAGMATQSVTREKQRLFLMTGSGTTDLISKACSPFGFQWVYDAYGLGTSAARALLKRGGKSWFFITADYTFGYSLAGAAQQAVKAAGGTVLGEVRHPFNTADFSSYILQAQASKAQVVALATGGGDMANAIKSAAEFGIVKGGQRIAALLMYDDDVKAVGLQTMQGLVIPTPFYWNQDAKARAWSERFMARMNGKAPTMIQAGSYSAVLHYLKAVKNAGTLDATAVAAEMRKMPVEDFMSDHVKIRADGHLMRPMRIFQIKSPAESKGPWDIYKPLEIVSAEDSALPVAESQCPLLKKP